MSHVSFLLNAWIRFLTIPATWPACASLRPAASASGPQKMGAGKGESLKGGGLGAQRMTSLQKHLVCHNYYCK